MPSLKNCFLTVPCTTWTACSDTHGSLGLPGRVFDSPGLGWGLIICIFNTFLSNQLMWMVGGPCLENPALGHCSPPPPPNCYWLQSVMEQPWGLESQRHEFGACSCSFLPVCPWASSLTLLGISFLICVNPTSLWGNLYKAPLHSAWQLVVVTKYCSPSPNPLFLLLPY